MFSDFFSTYGPSVIGGALFLAAAWIIAYFADKITERLLAKGAYFNPSIVTVTARIVRYSIFILSAIVVLEELGVEVATLIAALGIFGFAIAIGLRTTSTNFFTGIMLFVLEPYKVGDFIEGERVEGVVESISLFHTVVVTKDGVYVAIPNAAMWARSVQNFSRPRPICVEIDVTVKPGQPFGELKTVVTDTLKAESLVFHDFKPLIRVTDSKIKSKTIGVAFWSDVGHEREVRKLVSDALRVNLSAAGASVIKIGAKRKLKPKKKNATPVSTPPAAPAADEEGA